MYLFIQCTGKEKWGDQLVWPFIGGGGHVPPLFDELNCRKRSKYYNKVVILLDNHGLFLSKLLVANVLLSEA